MFKKIAAWFGHNNLTPSAIIAVFIFAAIGTAALPILTQIGLATLEKLDRAVITLSKIELFMAAEVERDRQRDDRIDNTEHATIRHQGQLTDHGNRLVRIETLTERLR